MDRPRTALVVPIAASFAAAFVFAALPMPDWAASWRPPWVGLVLLFWCFAAPERVGVVVGWSCGLILDALVGTLIGQHALGLAVVAWLGHRVRRRVRLLPVWQQALAVAGLLAVEQFLVSWVTGLRGGAVNVLAHVSVPLAGALMWPWTFLVLRRLHGRYQDR